MRNHFWLIVTVVVSTGVSAQVVKCRDAGGKIQFADHCPSGWQKMQEVPTSHAPQTANGASPGWQQRATEFQIRQNERRDKELAEKKEKEIAATECANARRRLEILQGGTPLITRGAFTKDPEYLPDERRALEIEREHKTLLGCR